MTAKTAADSTNAEAAGAQTVTSADTAPIPYAASAIAKRYALTKPRTRTSAASGSTTGSLASAGTTQTSEPSEPPTNGLSKRWRKPKDAKAFASQANEVATMILNGEMDLEVARVYSGVSRTMAQVLSAEVYRARFLQQAPDLTFEDDE